MSFLDQIKARGAHTSVAHPPPLKSSQNADALTGGASAAPVPPTAPPVAPDAPPAGPPPDAPTAPAAPEMIKATPQPTAPSAAPVVLARRFHAGSGGSGGSGSANADSKSADVKSAVSETAAAAGPNAGLAAPFVPVISPPAPTAPVRFALCQWPGIGTKANLLWLDEFLVAKTKQSLKPDVVVFSEHWLDASAGLVVDLKTNKFLSAMRDLAIKHRVMLVLGTMPEAAASTTTDKDSKKIYATTVIIDSSGELVGSYRKQGMYQTSERMVYGTATGVFASKEVGKCGVLICLDIERAPFLDATLARAPAVLFNPAWIPPPNTKDNKYPSIVLYVCGRSL